MIIPREVLSVIVNRKVEAILKRRVKDQLNEIGLSTDIPENVYDPERDKIEDPWDSEEDLSNFYDYKYL